MTAVDYGYVKERLQKAVEETCGRETNYRMGKLVGMVTVYLELGIISKDEGKELLVYFLDLA